MYIYMYICSYIHSCSWVKQRRRSRDRLPAGEKCSAPKIVHELRAPKFVGKFAQEPQRNRPHPWTQAPTATVWSRWSSAPSSWAMSKMEAFTGPLITQALKPSLWPCLRPLLPLRWCVCVRVCVCMCVCVCVCVHTLRIQRCSTVHALRNLQRIYG